MLSYLLIITALIGGLTATPIVFKNVSGNIAIKAKNYDYFEFSVRLSK